MQTTKHIDKRKASAIYSAIYCKELSKVARQAFYDGMAFFEGVKAGAITDDMVCEDFFAILNECNHNDREL